MTDSESNINVMTLSIQFHYAESSILYFNCNAECYAECRYAECYYAECRYAECRSTVFMRCFIKRHCNALLSPIVCSLK